METHLTLEEIKKYIDDPNMSEEYLLWLESVSEHIEECETCQKRIHKAIVTDALLEEDSMKEMFRLVNQEEDIRRNIVICKLYQMAQDAGIQEERKNNLMNLMQNMQTQMAKAYMVQAAMLQKRAGVSRGEERFAKEDLEIRYRENCLQVCCKKEPGKEFSAVLNQEGKEPQIAKALWEDTEECFVAEFEIEDNQTNFEIYIIP